MGNEIFVLILPLLIAIFILGFFRSSNRFRLASQRQGPLVSTDALDQLSLHLIIYFVLLLVPVGGSMAGSWGKPVALALLFIIVVSLIVRFKKLGNE